MSVNNRHTRRILLAACGMTPQIVTESLYALAVRNNIPWLPTEIKLITTRNGRERARLTLLEGERWLHRFYEEYNLPPAQFDLDSVEVLTSESGEPLEDIRTPADNRRAADQIANFVRSLTQDESTQIHASLAGGRKTIGFFLGHAMSLYARAHDQLSHVLVSEPFENNPEFFYPSRESRVIYSPRPDCQPLDASKAEVTLAELPFVRLRDLMPREFLNRPLPFQEAVDVVQTALSAELIIDLKARKIVAGGREVFLQPVELAFLSMLARRTVNGEGPIPGPTQGPDPDLAKAFLREYEMIRGKFSTHERTHRALKDGMDRDFFLQKRSLLEKALRASLGPMCGPYLVQTEGSRPNTRYKLSLDPSKIRWNNSYAAPSPK
jgi:CRISPR-associated protein (TIGR02584 family)